MSQNEYTKLLNELKNTKKGLEDLKRQNYILSEQLKMKSTHLHLILKYTPVMLFGVNPDGLIELSVGNGLVNYQIHAATYIGQYINDVFKHNTTLLKSIHEGIQGKATELYTSFLEFDNIPVSIEPVFDEEEQLLHVYIVSYFA